MKKITLMLSGAAAAALLFTSCGGSSSRSGGAKGAAGPASTSSFTGTTVTFNPTIVFTAEGQFTYENDEENSPFDFEPTPIAGTFTYVPSANFKTGTFTFTLDGETDTAFGSNFVVVEGFVTGFTITFPGVGKYFATVSGQLEAAVIDDGGTDGDDTTGGEDFTFQGNGNIATGTVFSKEYLAGNSQGDIGSSPLDTYSPGENVDFSISGSGALEFAGENGTLSLPFTAASEGILRYDGSYNGGTVTAVFDTKPTAAPSDFTVTWTGQFNGETIPIDGKVFSN